MSYQTIEVHNSTPHIGAEIRGVDLSKPLGNQQFQEVHDALMDRLVIFFRDQKLSIETTRPSTLPARIGTLTYRATPSRPWARSFILPKCLPTAVATPCSPTCISLTKCSRSRSAS